MISLYHLCQSLPSLYQVHGKNQKTNLVGYFPKRSDIIINKIYNNKYLPRKKVRDTLYPDHIAKVCLSHFSENVVKWQRLPTSTAGGCFYHMAKTWQRLAKIRFGV